MANRLLTPRLSMGAISVTHAMGFRLQERRLLSTTRRSVTKPQTPMTIIPVITRSVRESVRPSMITEPSPVGTPVISPTTIRIQAKPWAMRSPLKIAGSEAGSTTWRNMPSPEQPSMAAASNKRTSTERTPKIVLSRIG